MKFVMTYDIRLVGLASVELPETQDSRPVASSKSCSHLIEANAIHTRMAVAAISRDWHWLSILPQVDRTVKTTRDVCFVNLLLVRIGKCNC